MIILLIPIIIILVAWFVLIPIINLQRPTRRKGKSVVYPALDDEIRWKIVSMKFDYGDDDDLLKPYNDYFERKDER